MRTLMIIATITISVFALFIVYLKFDEKQFEASLPEPSTIASESVKKGKNGLSKIGVNDLKSAPVEQTEQALSQSTTGTQSGAVEQSQDLIDEVKFDIDHNDTEQEIDSIDEFYIEEPESHGKKKKGQEEYFYHTPSGIPDRIYAMSPDEQEKELKRRQQKLIEDFGDTPEVRMIIKHFHSKVLPRGTSIKFRGEEGVELIRAMSVLWPTESNIKTYNSLKAMQGNGWHAQ